jgi:hypothetical protein
MYARSLAVLFLTLTAGGAASAPQVSSSIESAARGSALEKGSVSFSVPKAIEESKGAGGGTGGAETFLRASGSNFIPRSSDATYSYSGAGCLQRNDTMGDTWFSLDVQIPDGSVIDFLRVYYNDNDATNDISAELWAFDGAGGTTLIAEAESSDSPGYGAAGSGFFSHVVDNLNQSLVVVVALRGGVGNDLTLCGIRIRYLAP